jgi:hypothetical protein
MVVFSKDKFVGVRFTALRDDRDKAAAVPTGDLDGGLFFNTLIF